MNLVHYNNAFEPEEARRISECLEIHYTPKHGSWLDIRQDGNKLEW
jgi:hypothetical protein